MKQSAEWLSRCDALPEECRFGAGPEQLFKYSFAALSVLESKKFQNATTKLKECCERREITEHISKAKESFCSFPRSRFLGCHATLPPPPPPQKKRLLTSELHSFLIVVAVCLRSFEQTNHVKMGLTDLRDSRCVSVVLTKAFLVLRLQACL